MTSMLYVQYACNIRPLSAYCKYIVRRLYAQYMIVCWMYVKYTMHIVLQMCNDAFIVVARNRTSYTSFILLVCHQYNAENVNVMSSTFFWFYLFCFVSISPTFTSWWICLIIYVCIQLMIGLGYYISHLAWKGKKKTNKTKNMEIIIFILSVMCWRHTSNIKLVSEVRFLASTMNVSLYVCSTMHCIVCIHSLYDHILYAWYAYNVLTICIQYTHVVRKLHVQFTCHNGVCEPKYHWHWHRWWYCHPIYFYCVKLYYKNGTNWVTASPEG